MSERPLVDIVFAATLLKAAAPQAFAELIEAFRSLEKKAVIDMVSSDLTNEVFRTQGRVKTIQEIRRHLQDCAQLRDTYTRRQDHARPANP